MRKYLIIAISVLVLICSALVSVIRHQATENKRLQGNQVALLDTVSYYKSENEKNVASVQMLKLSKKEIEQHCQDLTQTVKDLGIKIKRIQSASSSVTQTDLDIKPVVRDSIVYRDTTFLKLKSIEWKDPWVSVKGLMDVKLNKLDLNIQSVDTLKQIVWRVPKKFLFFRWGTKAIRQEIVSSNPHTKIVYTKYIELKRKKKK